MRDPNRIDPILWKLAEAWRVDPDMRLGQLIYVAVRPKTEVLDIINIEDDVIERGLDRLREQDALGRRSRE